eukprot:gnl/TRDRNA2_/TRDRNA2_41041_c0_seq1.p1 gnl/TRDRNA2_/TRDRNA2_41041_c0~~gnl/TRDRNA2_/TRDRNA2_41041_c0_seq1.p1  ORF type:complete len:302 (+),score=54.65 gnl/TRDRNA2_/TRDRNA2_41041_c0_seq1:73-906(+)
MGTFAKRLGQLGAKALETESANILKTSAANKIPGSLGKALDGTLRRGHDMKVFGLGTAASMADRSRYGRFTTSMYAVYSAMEEEMDAATAKVAPAVYDVWAVHGGVLRRAPALGADLSDVGISPDKLSLSPATVRYVEAVRAAGADDRERSGGRMLGHMYCRYFADLFGGQMLGLPTRVALTLPPETPRHYVFGLPPEMGRRIFIEEVYRSLNAAGEKLPPAQFDDVVEEAALAFQCNIDVYGEEPIRAAAVRGVVNVATGFLANPKEMMSFMSAKG